MKTYMMTLLLLLSTLNLMAGNNPAYEQAMKNQLEEMNSAENAMQLQQVAQGFSRIANMNASEWLPDYYAAFCLIDAGMRSQEGIKQKDALFHEAKKHIEKATKAHGSNAELMAMQGYALMGELSADPESRGQSMSGLVFGTFHKALAMDPENPRAMILLANMEMGTAKFFGQSSDKSCELIQQSLQLFEKEAAKEITNPFLPIWGRDYAEKANTQCSE